MAVIRVTSSRALGGDADRLTLAEALSLANGKLPPDALSPAQLAWISGDVERDGELTIRLELGKETVISFADTATLEPVLPVVKTSKKLILEGENTTLSGPGSGIGLVLSSSHCAVRNLRFSGFYISLLLTQDERSVQNISVCDCRFAEISQACILAGLTGSELSMEGIQIQGCEMVAPSRRNRSNSCTAILLTAALDANGSRPLHGITLRDLSLKRNRVKPNPDGTTFSEGFTIYASCDLSYALGGRAGAGAKTDIDRCVVENVQIEHNNIDGVDDTCIGFVGALPARTRCAAKNFRIAHNRVIYTLTGICASSCNQYAGGESYGCVASGITIEHNNIAPGPNAPHEPSMGIGLLNVRAEAMRITCADCLLEEAVIRDNEIIGRDWGIVLEAMHSTMDLPAPSRLENCRIRRITIENNRITGASQPLRLFGARLEGRTDAFWGYGRVEANPDYPYSVYACDNSIDHVIVRGNKAREFDCFLTAAGAWAAGRGFARGNRIGPDIVLEDNLLDNGQKVFTYRKFTPDQILYEEACGMGNRVLGNLAVPDRPTEKGASK